MKYFLTILAVLFNLILLGQDCETVFSDNDRVTIIASGFFYNNCSDLEIDTVYILERFKGEHPDCYQLFHSDKKYLISESWKSNDTTFGFDYYPNGNIKSKSIDVNNEWVYHSTHYPNGNLRTGGYHNLDTLQHNKFFYPSGILRREWYSYNFAPYNQEREYYENGKVACIIEHTVFNDSLLDYSNYLGTDVLSETYYDVNGEIITDNPFAFETFTIHIQPRPDYQGSVIQDSIYPHRLIVNQTGYDEDMSLLTEKICDNIEWNNLTCTKGVAWIGILINKKGLFESIEVQFDNIQTSAEIENAIKKIQKWDIGRFNGETVNTYIYVPLILNF